MRVVSHTPGGLITVASDGQGPRTWTGEPLLLTDSAEVTVTATGPFPEVTVRSASYTRVDPWPASPDAGDESGLHTRTYLGAWDRLPDWATLTPNSELVQPAVAVPAGLPPEDIGVVLNGTIEIPRRGAYRFWLSSDDGSRLWIDGRLVVDNDGLHGSTPVHGDVPLEAGPHTIEVEFFQHLGGIDLKLEWRGPGFARREVPAEAYRH